MAATTDGFAESFDTLDGAFWYVSDFAIGDGWIDTAWEADNVSVSDGMVTLTLDDGDKDGKSWTGAEIQTLSTWGYGRYEVTMRASGETGVNSNFFTYTGPYFGDAHNEIDFEFLGKDPTRVWVNYYGADGQYGGSWVDLGFDASADFHSYAFEWAPDSISWYADGKLIHVAEATLPALPDTESKVYMNIWAGSEGWLGAPTFTGATSAVYDAVAYTPLATEPERILRAWFVDSDTDARIAELTDGGAYDAALFAGRSVTVLAEIGGDWLSGGVGSVGFDLDGGAATRTESVAPYALFGDAGAGSSDLHGGMALGEGAHALELTLHELRGGGGAGLGGARFDFTVEGTAEPAPPVTLWLCDAETDAPIVALSQGAVLDGAALAGRSLTVVAEVAPDLAAAGLAESVRLDLDYGAVAKTENVAPYALFGDAGGDLAGGLTLAEGAHRLTARVFSENGAAGVETAALDIAFSVEGGGPAPDVSAGVLSLLMIDPTTDETLATVRNGDSLSAALVEGREITFAVELDDAYAAAQDVGSVVFDLDDGLAARTENVAPYALFGDDSGDYRAGGLSLDPGQHRLDIALHAERSGWGDPLDAMTIGFEIGDAPLAA